ncbi:MAG: chromosomal replication initiator protein DnaA [Candidatus Auribacterota bacterium]
MNTPAFWENVLKRIRTNTSEFSFNSWFQCIQKVYVEDGTLHIELPNKLAKNWMIENFSALIKESIFMESGEEYILQFEVVENAVSAAAVSELKQADTEKQKKAPARRFPISRSSLESQSPVLNQNYTFDSFVVGSSNRFAHAAALAVARTPANAYNPLFIYGGVGLGKTHLMQSIGNKHLEINPDARVYYLSSEIFTNQLIDAIQNRNTVKFRKKYRNVDILLIDDIQFLSGKEQTQEEFFHTFNTLYDAHKQIVITSDRPPKDISNLADRLVSRFEWGLVTDLQPPDVETRIAILQKKAELSNLEVPEDIIPFLAKRITSNIRKLEGALIRLASYSSITKSSMNVALAEEILKDTLDDHISATVTIDSILRFLADQFDIRVQDLLAKGRTKNIALPRQIAMYLSRNLTSNSLPEIGKALGGRDHTTIMHGIKSIESKMDENSDFKKSITSYVTQLKKP